MTFFIFKKVISEGYIIQDLVVRRDKVLIFIFMFKRDQSEFWGKINNWIINAGSEV